MKKIKLLIIMLITVLVMNVKADMGPPSIIEHQVMVTNKSGAICYNDGKKTKDVIPYGATFNISDDIDANGFVAVSYKDIYCQVKSSDISSKTQSFDMNDKGVTKIENKKAVILAKGGLNMRKGPAVTYSKIMTVPQYAVVTLTHSAGTYWYYIDYNGTKGWITGMNGYFGYEGREVLTSYQEMKVYANYDRKTVLTKIPANTEISEYINIVSRSNYDICHYVNYNGIKGYVEHMLYKTDGTGKIKLLKDYDVTTEYGELIRKLTANQEIEYTMMNGSDTFYFPDKKIEAYINPDAFTYVNKANILTKKTGYIGEGLFGETKQEIKEEEPIKEEDPIIEPEKDNKKDIIIIGLLAGIFLALTALVIIKLVNSKKETKVIDKEITKKEVVDDNKEV